MHGRRRRVGEALAGEHVQHGLLLRKRPPRTLFTSLSIGACEVTRVRLMR